MPRTVTPLWPSWKKRRAALLTQYAEVFLPQSALRRTYEASGTSMSRNEGRLFSSPNVSRTSEPGMWMPSKSCCSRISVCVALAAARPLPLRPFVNTTLALPRDLYRFRYGTAPDVDGIDHDLRQAKRRARCDVGKCRIVAVAGRREREREERSPTLGQRVAAGAVVNTDARDPLRDALERTAD